MRGRLRVFSLFLGLAFWLALCQFPGASFAKASIPTVEPLQSLGTAWTASSTPDWSEGAEVSPEIRVNPYGALASQLPALIRQGRLHALEYPVEISGILLPFRPFQSFIEDPQPSGLRDLIQKAFKGFTHIRSTDDIFREVGLHPYPRTSTQGTSAQSSSAQGANSPYFIPFRGSAPPSYRMGVTLMMKDHVQGFTLSCAACHSAELFGKKVLGMTNRFPRANEFFIAGKLASSLAEPALFSAVTGATRDETALYAKLRESARSVGVKKPLTLGLDTSLAQVALSLARRNQDDYATKSAIRAEFPRSEILTSRPADSKPSVWWNLKYKNRWLSDGSVVSGNPIFTNIIWNEIGRGTDLRELEGWLSENSTLIKELTTSVFASEAPRYTDFFRASSLDPEKVRLGQKIYRQACARCHGTYEKTWDLAEAAALPWIEQLKTAQVRYPEKTRVIDVQTDPLRHQGMSSLARGLNPLSISRRNGIVIKPQKGYVPPPLVGIWARWPYFHNNSAPTLCAVLTRADKRPVKYFAGEAIDRERDFDAECNGYPSGTKVPSAWKRDAAYQYDTRRAGMSNSGHDEGVFLKDGAELLTPDDKLALIQFLQTL
ncbi:MAG: cytochrome c [Methylotenera sp.]|nr:cytochrome c [Oligoflexia bacterium]